MGKKLNTKKKMQNGAINTTGQNTVYLFLLCFVFMAHLSLLFMVIIHTMNDSIFIIVVIRFFFKKAFQI